MPLIDDTYLATGGATIAPGINTGAVTTGIGPVGRVVVYDVVPAALSTSNVSASSSPAASSLLLAAGTGTTATTVNGVSVIKLDCPRVLRITSGGTDAGITFNCVGYDQYLAPITENITGASASVATGKKAWQYVASITPSAAVSTTCSVGTGDIFGLPFYVGSACYIQGAQWNATLAKDTGTLVLGVTTTPATKTTGDVRGTYAPSSGASDGTKRLVITQALSAAQVGASATAVTVLGVTQA